MVELRSTSALPSALIPPPSPLAELRAMTAQVSFETLFGSCPFGSSAFHSGSSAFGSCEQLDASRRPRSDLQSSSARLFALNVASLGRVLGIGDAAGEADAAAGLGGLLRRLAAAQRWR